MDIRVTVEGTPEQLYRTLLEVFRAEYEEATGNLLSYEDTKEGISYTKRFGKGQEQSIQVTLARLVQNECYAVRVQSNRGTQLLTYQLYPTKEGKVVISYMEDVLPKNRWQTLNYRFLYPLMKKRLEKHRRLQLLTFAEYAQKKEVP